MTHPLNNLTHTLGAIVFLVALNPYFVLFSTAGYVLYFLLLIARWKAFEQRVRWGFLIYPALPALCWIALILAD